MILVALILKQRQEKKVIENQDQDIHYNYHLLDHLMLRGHWL